MFTGIVEEKGRVLSFVEGEASWRLEVAVSLVSEGTRIGDSIAVNGCCLTAVAVEPGRLAFDLLEETRRVTNLRDARPGASVNLERSLRHDGRIGGHFVTGHVDALGEIVALEPDGKDFALKVAAPEAFAKYLVYKGCIAIDGISLTVARVSGSEIVIWLIPHTLEVTALSERKAGDAVNLEFDLLAKYAERILQGEAAANPYLAKRA